MPTSIYKKYCLEDLLLSLRRKILESAKREGLKHDLTFSQIEVLRLVGMSGKKTMKSIATYLKITPPSATELVAEMEKRGLVTREGDKKDKRVVFVVLTKASKKHFTTICKSKNLLFKKMISKLNGVDRKNLERIIKILIAK